MEGLADYVSLKTYQIFPLVDDFCIENILLRMREKKTAGLTSISQDAVKGRHYFVGAVLGLALDFCQVQDWKQRVEQGASLHELLVQAVPLSVQEREERSRMLLEHEGVETIRLGIRQKLETEKSSYESLKERFSQLEGVPVCVGLPKQHTSAGGRNEKTHHFDNEAIFLKETSYAVSQDRLWALRFESMPLIIEGSQGDRTFKLKEETLFWVNGNACRLKDILENSRPLPFASLSWEDKNCQLECSLPGNLQVKDGTLYIEFD